MEAVQLKMTWLCKYEACPYLVQGHACSLEGMADCGYVIKPVIPCLPFNQILYEWLNEKE
jgi:hypothetical protein